MSKIGFILAQLWNERCFGRDGMTWAKPCTPGVNVVGPIGVQGANFLHILGVEHVDGLLAIFV